jgi:hypothetical protein
VKGELTIQIFGRALGDGTAHRKTANQVDEGAKPFAMILAHGADERRNGAGVRQIARISARGVSARGDRGSARLGLLRRSVHENEGGVEVGERSRDHFANLAVATYACEENIRAGEHQRRD